MADIKKTYVASSAVSITLASLATSSTLVAGRSSATIDNSSTKYLDYLLAGKIKAGSSAPTAGTSIEVWVWAPLDDTPTYPDTITGSDANITVTSVDIKASSMRLAASMTVDATTGRTYVFAPVSIASLFGGEMPRKFGVFVVQNTGQILDATGGSHVLSISPSYVSAS